MSAKTTMTNAEAVRRVKGLRALNDIQTPLPAVVTYRILQNVHALEDALKPMADAEETILGRYSGGRKEFVIDREKDPDAFEACSKELLKLQEITIDVEVEKIQLKQIENSELPVSAVFALDFMIERPEGE